MFKQGVPSVYTFDVKNVQKSELRLLHKFEQGLLVPFSRQNHEHVMRMVVLFKRGPRPSKHPALVFWLLMQAAHLYSVYTYTTHYLYFQKAI